MPSSDFIDYVRIFCASGKGGDGAMHLHRAKYIAKGGPDGGDGGRGGHVVLRAQSRYWTLMHLKYRKHLRAENGKNGSSALRHGADGRDIIVDLPPGTVVRDAETGEMLMELTRDREEHILCKGGRGGKGNAFFKSSTLQTPRFAQEGEPGVEKWVSLELKILADVGLVGFPNAGKSTLLAAVSAARPKIADYPFTTIEPKVGIVSYRDDLSFVMADIPGIIEDAHTGKGLGLRFLKHIERNALLLFVISAENLDIGRQYRILLNELQQYKAELLDKRRILAVSKCDLLDPYCMAKVKKTLPGDLPCLFISAHNGTGMTTLKDCIWQELHRDNYYKIP